jgi:hypothetical protein
MKHILIYILTLLPFLAGAQGENDNWYFGYHCRVNFSGSSPVVPAINQMDAFEACGTVSDSSGGLLFYTNGQQIWNRAHQVMQNGSGLKGKPSSQQLAIVKHPGNANQYFVFTTGFNHPDSINCHIMYSIVDMSLGNLDIYGNPLGAVLSNAKNVSVLDYQGNKFRGEAITVVPSPYNTFWVLIPSAKKLYSYTVNNNGFNNGAPVVSNLDFPTSMIPSNHFSIKVSPKLSSNMNFSNYLCISSWSDPSYVNKVFSFNDVTGQITNNYALSINSTNSYLPEFNKDASVLYLGYFKMYAFDLLTSTPFNINYMEIYDLGPGRDCGSIQRNKYDDIYFSVPNNKFLSKIINPDVYGPNISVDLDNIPLGLAPYGDSADAMYGLPQLVPVLSNTYYPCMNSLVLSTYEMHNNFTYHIGYQITTEADYTIDPHQDITMKAGNNILLLPNTYVMNGASYFAKIERCNPYSKQEIKTEKGLEKISLFVDLDKDVYKSDDILIYPNPASTLVTIDTRNQKLLNWELYDMAGRLLSKGDTNSVKVAGLPPSVYLLRVGLANGRNSYKKITVQ